LLLGKFSGIANGGGPESTAITPVADSVATSAPDQAALDKAAPDKAAGQAAADEAAANQAALDKAAVNGRTSACPPASSPCRPLAGMGAHRTRRMSAMLEPVSPYRDVVTLFLRVLLFVTLAEPTPS
jgi:hypothetical protein